MTTATLRNQAYDVIFNKLVNGEYKPGERLANRTLAKEMGMSFIPIREAISQLASEGLVEHRPKLGTFVVEADRQEIEELYGLRCALECYAAEQMAGRMPEDDLAQMQRHNDELLGIVEEMKRANAKVMLQEDNDRWVLADAAFHMTLLKAQGNRRTIKTVSDLRVMTHIFARRRDDRTLQTASRVCQEHQQIIDALRDGDAEAARSAMMQQIKQGQNIAMQVFDRQRANEAAGRTTSNRYLESLQTRLGDVERGED